MIGSVSHTVLTGSSGIKLSGSALPKVVPPVNSYVNVNILDKVGSAYKILIDGSVFQTKLPFFAEIGEQILARVMSHKPFTLGMDNFASGKLLDSTALSAVLLKMGLSDTAISKSVLKSVIEKNKPLVKSKLNRMVEYLEEHNLMLDELQSLLMINVFWSSRQDEANKFLASFQKIFDISFDELAKKIFENTKNINAFAPGEPICEKTNEILVFDPDSEKKVKNLSAVKDKSKGFLQLAKLYTETDKLGRIPLSVVTYVRDLKKLLLKYILQKSLFSRYDIHPEFAIIKDANSFQLALYNIDRLNLDGGELSFNISSIFKKDRFGDFIFNSYTSSERINGELSTVVQNLSLLNNKIPLLNEFLSKEYGIYSGIKVAIIEANKNLSNSKPVALRSIDKIA